MYTPLHCHTHYSLLDGASKPEKLAERCEELGIKSCAITDHGVVTGHVKFSSAMKKYDIKPILGTEFYVSGLDATIKDGSNSMSNLTHLVMLAKNKKGWKDLIKMVSRANDEDVFYYRPRLDIHKMAPFCENLIAFSGHLGSALGNAVFYPGSDELRSDAFEVAKATAKQYMNIFGRERFFVEIQRMDIEHSDKQRIISDILRKVAKELDLKTIATGDTHYVNQSDWEDHHVLLCANMKTTLPKIRQKRRNGEDVGFSGFFKSNNYHLPDIAHLKKCGNTDEEIENTNLVASLCEEYDITNKPILPKFPWTEGMTENEYLRHLCRKGWAEKNNGWDVQEYGDRVKRELEVFEEAGLAGYFLIVQDYVKWTKSKGWLVGPGRGSACGCLISYLLGITSIDPIPYGLIFERFYNPGRNTGDHVSLPDIDMDFPISKREQVIAYLREKYGQNKVGQIITLGRYQGRGAIKEVLRVHEACSFEEMNEITKSIPHEHEVNDQMEASGDESILQWVLENQPDSVKDYVQLEASGELVGEYAQYFKQAMRLEGTYKTQGKHAAGIVLGNDALSEICPMVRDPHGDEKLAGMDMGDLENMGLVKLDILGVAALDKLMWVNNLLQYGEINP